MKKWFQCAVVLIICALLVIQPAQISAITVVDGIEYCESVSEAAEILRDQMALREKEIAVSIITKDDISTVAQAIFDEALVHTGNPTEGDYLAYQHGGAIIDAVGYRSGDTYYLTYTYKMNDYYSTVEQEQALDAAVTALLQELDIEDASDYDKVKAIYDWMTENIVYDYDHLDDSSYLTQYTAYAALINRTSVCQGYALLLYRLLLEVGVDCRIITGDSGGRHAWNIVKLDGRYYNLDATWDAVERQAGFDYVYFLKAQESFSEDHTRDAQFETVNFHTQYPMADKDYSTVAWLDWSDVITISGVTGVTAEELIEAAGCDGAVVTESGETLAPDAVVGTGMMLSVTENGESVQWPIVVAGDINGDGNITVTDLLAVKAHLLGKSRLEDLQAKAADINGNGVITVTDLLQIKERILGMSKQ